MIKLLPVPRSAPLPPVATLYPKLQEIWDVPASVLKVFVAHTNDCSARPGETLFVDVRAKAKPDRTPTAVAHKMKQMGLLFKTHGHNANIRVELFEPSLSQSYMEQG